MGDWERALEIGTVQTPIEWGIFLIEKFDVFEKWMSGKTIFDPTSGEGNLLEALIVYGLRRGYALSQLPIRNIYGNELNESLYRYSISKFYKKYGLDLSFQITNQDILDLPAREYDIIIGNPPWITYADLPETYKQKIRDYIFDYEMAHNPRELLLGKSRMNIAALIIRVSIKKFLRIGGEAIFFMPLSLLLGEDSSKPFRSYQVGSIPYAPMKVYDFGEWDIFEDVATRYGICSFRKGIEARFPIPYFMYSDSRWEERSARPLTQLTDPLVIGSTELQIPRIAVSLFSKPRQGVNTCGANEVFIFKKLKLISEELVCVSNSKNKEVILPKKYVFPLISKKQFSDAGSMEPERWILLPYHNDGKPLTWAEISRYPSLKAYLENCRPILENRKGVLIHSFIKKGYWWALLGVGSYSFAPYKVVWEAFGKTVFVPIIVTGIWQANQALHAYMPARTPQEAEYIRNQLSRKEVTAYLLATQMAGTKNWAQPGRIARLLHYREKEDTLPLSYL